MRKPRVFVTRELPGPGMERLLRECDADVWPGSDPPSRNAMLERSAGCEALVTMLSDRVDAELLERAGSQLVVISNMAVGYDNIDLEAARGRGILVTNTPGVLTQATADLAFSLICCAARRIGEGMDYVRAGRWTSWGPKVLLGCDLFEATLGIVGLGRIGRAVARRGMGFGMHVIYFDPGVGGVVDGVEPRADLDSLLSQADIVSLHAPLTIGTYHLIDRRKLERMKTSAILVNTARGQLVDPDALYDALEMGEIGYAALDVTDPEPLPANHRLLTLPNCLVVPHIGSASHSTRNRMANMVAENLLAALRGETPPNVVH